MKNKSKKPTTRLILERLEPRVLYSADPLGLTVGVVLFEDENIEADIQTFERFSSLDTLDTNTDTNTSVDLIFIDIRSETNRVTLQSLLASEHSEAIVYIIDPTEDGIESLTGVINSYESVSSIHFLAHGDNQGLRLGTDWLDIDTVDGFADHLTSWRGSLSETADILLYGCNLTAGTDGLQLIEELATFTGADIAASSDKTGHQDFNGDWDLESTTGEIETRSLGTPSIQNNWEGSLELISVTTEDDVVDGDISTIAALKLDPGADNAISLREAVIAANNTPGADEINLPVGHYHFEDNPAPENEDNALRGDLDILDTLTITGADAETTEIHAQNNDRMFEVFGVDFTLQNVKLREGEVDQNGGAIRIVAGTTTLDNVILEDNESVNESGGAVHIHDGNLVINDSQIFSNLANLDGGAVAATGVANIEINNSIIHTNDANVVGGGIALLGTGTATLTNNYIYNNNADIGGGLMIDTAASLDLSTTTFEANDANYGGAIYIKGNANIDSTTISGNTSDQNGAGIEIESGTVDITHSTFTQNEVADTSARADAINIKVAATVSIGSTIIADNNANTRDEVTGNFTSTGFNLSGDTLAGFDQTTDINNGAVNLGGLSSAGGGPPTHAPQAGSDAIDSGAERSGTDANGANANFYADIGAVEYNPGVIANKLFWVDSDGWIYRANEDGTGVQQIFQTDLTPQDIEYDPVTNRIYWSETDGQYGQIRSTDVYGNNLQETPLSTYSDGSENPPSLMAPYGIAIDSANGIMYIAANAEQGTNSALLRAERIYQYTINGDGSITYDSILYELNRLSNPQMHTVIDLHFEPDIDGRAMLVWTEAGADAVPLFGLPDLPAVPVSIIFFDLSDDSFQFIVPVDGSITSMMAYDSVNQTGYLVNENALISYTYDHDTPTFTEVANDGNATIVGVTFDTDSNLVWWTNDNGDIGTSDSTLTTENTVISTTGTPGAITLGHIPTLDSPAMLDVNTGSNTVTQGGTQTITQAMLHATDDFATDTNITYEQLNPLNHGKLILNGTDIGPGSTFTQQQINDLELVYEHDGTEGITDNLVLSVNDGVNAPFPASFTFEISIVYQNDFTPVANDETITLDQNASTTLLTDGETTSVLDNDIDPDGGETLTAAVKPSAGVSHGTLTLNSDGTFTYTHDGSENLTDSFTYIVTDLGGATDEATVTITINPINDFTPVANADNITVTEGTAISLLDDGSTTSVLANDTDADAGDTMTATIKPGFNVSHGTLALAADGTFTYTHNGTENLTDSFTYVLTDSGGLTSEATVTITVTPVSDFDPVANAESIVVTEGTATSVLSDGSTTSVLANDTDADAGDTMTATVKAGFDVSHGTLSLATDGTFTYTHDDSENLTDSFTYVLTDAGGRTSEATVSITVTPVNDFAPAANTDTITVTEGTAISVLDDGSTTSILANDTDADAGDSMSATVKAGFDVSHGTLVLATDGTFTYTHDGSENLTDSFTYIVSDSGGLTSEATVTITVTPVSDFDPVANADNITVTEGTTISVLDDGSTLSVLNNDTDADAGDTMTATVKAGFDVAHGTLVLATDGTFTYTHDGTENLTDSFTYVLTDAGGRTSEATVTITVTPVSDFDPVANAESIVVTEGMATSLLDDGVTTSVLANDTDVDAGDTMTATIKAGFDVAHGTLVLATDGTFTYTHDGTENLTDSFTYVLTDAGGRTSEATVSITVTPVSDFDPVANADSITVSEGTAISVLDDGSTTSILANDTDADAGDTMTATVKAGFDVAHGTLVLATDGTFTYTHDGTENLSDSFTYVLTDDGGRTSEATVSITVTPVSDFDPVANTESIVVAEGTATSLLDDGVTISVLANDTDDDAGDTMTATVKAGFDVAHGTLVLATDGTFTYTHNGSENLLDSFTYIVTDSGGRTSEATVTITVTPVSDFDPVANADAITVTEGTAIGVLDDGSTTSILANDTDADAGDTMTATVKAGFDVAHGTLVLATDGTFTYTHDGTENLTDSFTYVLTDAGGRTSETTVTITVTPVSDFDPVANADSITVSEGTAISVLDDGSTTTILANDTDADASDTMTAAVKAGFDVAHGTLALASDGTFTYTHDGTENLTDSFTYILTDAGGRTSEATVSIIVTPVSNFDPVANTDSISVTEGTAINVLDDGSTTSVLANDTDADAGDTMTATVKAGFGVAHGTLVLATDGTFTYTHDGTENLTDSFTYVLTDAGGRTSEATVSITVAAVSDFDPVANADAINVDEGASVSVLDDGSTLSVLHNDTDADAGDTMVASIKAGADVSHGVLTLNPDGSFTYTHNDSENLNDQFTYIVTDAGGRTAEATVAITINPVNNHAPIAIPESIDVIEGGTTTVQSNGITDTILGNDMDADAGDTMEASIKPGEDAQYGSLTLNANGTFSYTHDGSENLYDTFTYIVTDSGGLTSEATVDIFVTGINDNTPVLPADQLSVAEGGIATQFDSGRISLMADVTDSDAGDSFTFTITAQPQYGTLTTNPDGSFSYNHDGDSEIRQDSFSYVVTDAAGNQSLTKVVDIAITNVNDAPVLNQALLNYNAVERESFSQQLPADLFTDSEGDPWVIEISSASGQMPAWLEFDEQTRTLSGTPTGPDIGTQELIIQARDSNNVVSTQHTFEIVVAESTVPDEIVSTNLTISENTPGAVIGPLTLNGQAIASETVVTTDDARFEFVDGVLALTAESTVDYEQQPSIDLTVTTTDDIGDEVSDVITIQTTDLNDTPELYQAATTTVVPLTGELALPGDLFTDQDQDTLQYSAQSVDTASGELPLWLEFDEENLTFSVNGTPGDTSLQVEITADDGNGGIATTLVDLQFQLPTLEAALPESIEIVDNTADVIPEPEPEPEEQAVAEAQEPVSQVATLPTDPNDESIIDFEHIDIASLIKPLPRISAEATAVSTDYLTDFTETASESNIGEIKISNITIDTLGTRAINDSLTSLATSFDQQRELLEEAYDQSRNAIGRSITLTSGLSVGYLIWLIRGGTLMGSVMSSMPAWRLVDPLPILGSMGDDFDESEESLESMVKDETK